MPGLVARQDVEMSAKEVDDLAFARVRPLRAQYVAVSQAPNPIIVTRRRDSPPDSSGRFRFCVRHREPRKDFSTPRRRDAEKSSSNAALLPLVAALGAVVGFMRCIF